MKKSKTTKNFLPDDKELYIVVSASRSFIPLVLIPPGAAVVVAAPVKNGDVYEAVMNGAPACPPGCVPIPPGTPLPSRGSELVITSPGR